MEAVVSVQSSKIIREPKPIRLIAKDGSLRILHRGFEDKTSKFLEDIFTTCVDFQWRYIFIGFTSCFFLSWLAFAGVWHLLFWVHGDLQDQHLPDNQSTNNWTPCVYSIHDFSSTFLFSVETQSTIGFGLRGTSHRCPDAIILECLQSILGILIQGCLAGIVFAKLARPKMRAKTVTFSKVAVISLVNGKLRLMLRVANARNSQLLEAHFKAFVLGDVVTQEGVYVRNCQREIYLTTHIYGDEELENQDFGHLFLPLVVSHTIDSSSPLYRMSPEQLVHNKFELLITLEGVVEQSGNTVQARTSYLPQEILWAHSFINCVQQSVKHGGYLIEHEKIDGVVSDDTPCMSGEEIENRRTSDTADKQQDQKNGQTCDTADKLQDQKNRQTCDTSDKQQDQKNRQTCDTSDKQQDQKKQK